MTQSTLSLQDAKTTVDWVEVERLFTTTAISVRQIAKDHGVSAPGIAKRAKAKGWARPAEVAPAPVQSAAVEPQLQATVADSPVQPGKRGRKSSYNPELGTFICLEIAGGKSLRKVCAMEGMPDMSTVLRWLADDDKEFFHKQYARACEARGVALAEEAMEIVDQPVKTALELAHNRAKADQRKWYASKLSPKRFGDKLAVGGADDLPPVQVQERELTEAERAVRVLNALKSSPDLIASLVTGVQG